MVLVALLLSSCLPTGPSDLYRDGCVHVRDHGAIGDGIADDTEAVQQAIFAAMNGTRMVHVSGWHNDQTGPDVCFSPGDYLVTQTLNFTHSFAKPSGCAPSVRGLGGAVLRMNSSGADILRVPNAWYWRASGLTFVGGHHQLHLSNNNTDEGQIVIEKCAFHASTGAAIFTARPTPGPMPAEVLRERGSFSTQITVRDAKFIGCNQALVNWGDWTTVSDVW